MGHQKIRRKKATHRARRRTALIANRRRLGFIDNVVKSITIKCANCAMNFEHENERNVKLSVMRDPYTHEIAIIDAIFFTYGLTVADWSKTLAGEEVSESDFKITSDNVSSKGISLCHQCTSALENAYKSHQILKKLSHSESLFTKTLLDKWGGQSFEIPIKTEITDDFESPQSNDHKLCLEEMEIKEENNSEDEFPFFEPEEMTHSFESDGPLVEHSLNDRQSSSFSPFLPDTSENDPENPDETNCLNVPTLDVQRKVATQANGSSRKKGNSTELCPKEPAKYPNKYCGRTDRMSSHTSYRACADHPFQVVCCDKSFDAESTLKEHIFKCHKETEESFKGVKCNICEILIPLKSIMDHMKTFKRTRQLYFKCKVCSLQFQNTSSIIQHRKTHDPECVTWTCEICEAPIVSECDLIVHKVKKHSETPETKKIFPCNKCGAQFMKPDLFKMHFESHSPSHRTCKVCDMVLKSSKFISEHIRLKHSELLSAKYMCKICNLKFRSAVYLQKHKARNICNLPKRRFVCEKCGKTFQDSSDHKKHARNHEDMENPNKESFKCPICEKILKHRTSLKKHLAREHPKEPKKLFFCEKCGKSTKNMTNLRIHMKVHENKTAPD